MKQAIEIRRINSKSIILPELIPLIIPGFKNNSKPIITNVLSYSKLNSEDWFEKFVETTVSKIGREYFPIMRMSDGEYTFLLGQQYPYLEGHSVLRYFRSFLIVFRNKILKSKSFKAATLPNVSSGTYSKREIDSQKAKIIEQIKFISENGILALHLTYSIKPFQEHFHLPLRKWFDKNRIVISNENYFPFYFVYALLRGDYRSKIFLDKTILVLHSANGDKRSRIISSLKMEGVKKIIWHEISSSRSMLDEIKLESEYFDADWALVGAGVGKFNVMAQLSPLNIPCIDAGFVFEVWADDENKWKRPYMVTDSEWLESKINFL